MRLTAAVVITVAFAAGAAEAGEREEDCAFIEEAFTGLNASMNRVGASPNPAELPVIGVFADLQRNLIMLHGQRGCEAGALVDIIRESGDEAAAAASPTIENAEIEPLEKGMVVKSTANMRAGPSTDAPKIAVVSANGIVPVIGKVKGKNWFKVRLDGGVEGYIFGSLLGDPAEAAAQSFDEMKAKANKGDAEAQLWLGNFYVGRDMFEAVSWWQAAAEQGSPEAQYNLGVAYKRGGVLPQDDAKAEEWWTKAADGGHAGAKRALAGEADG